MRSPVRSASLVGVLAGMLPVASALGLPLTHSALVRQEALGEDAKVVLERVTALTRDTQKDVREAAENALQKLKGQP